MAPYHFRLPTDPATDDETSCLMIEQPIPMCTPFRVGYTPVTAIVPREAGPNTALERSGFSRL